MKNALLGIYVFFVVLFIHIIIFFQIKEEKMNYENSRQETLKLNEIKIEEHDKMDDNIYKDNVSYFLILLFF